MDSIWNFLGGSIGYLSILFGFIFFSFIGLASLGGLVKKSVWSNYKKIIYEKLSSIALVVFSLYMAYIMGRLLIKFTMEIIN